jgi:hypothetical protein
VFEPHENDFAVGRVFLGRRIPFPNLSMIDSDSELS